jgi:uroporphyrinogen decarboxylase
MDAMTRRERILAALDHKPGDVVPFDIGGTKTTSMNVVAENSLKDLLHTSAPTVWGNYRVQRVHMSEAMSRFFDVDVRRVGESYPVPLLPEVTAPTQIDEWGVEWTCSEEHGAYMPSVYDAPLARAESLTDLKNYPWPDPHSWQPADILARKARQYRQETDCAVCIDLPDAVVQFSQYLRGMEQWLMDLMLNKAFVSVMMGYIADIYVEMVNTVMSKVGDNADLVIIPDDLGGQNNLLMRPSVFRELIKPLYARIFDAIRANSPARIVLHSCGAVYWLLGDFVDLGVDGLNPVQVSARDMDTARLNREWGDKLCFWGGIDSQYVLPSGTPDEVRAEVKRRIDHMAGGSFVIAPVHIIQPEVPPENVLALAEAAHLYGGRSDGSRFRPENARQAYRDFETAGWLVNES